jgi:UDP-GlcNAc:undecaprenyl-phosphate GlcNAc-1-phosphate transferase
MPVFIHIYNFLHSYHFAYYISIVVFSTSITLIAIPSILHVARTRHLYDDLGHFRKQHDHGIPRLGGVGIFLSFTITILLLSVLNRSLPISYLLMSSIILFVMGLKDDLSGVNSSTKFLIQFIVGLILVVFGNIRLSSMYGILGIFDLPYIVSVILSILVILLIVNAFNLIDGIDGLAATIGIIANSTFATLFIYIHQYDLAVISLAMVGAIIGFIRYNITPARIFMGDTGALLIGLISVVMAIKLIELNKFTSGQLPGIYSVPALTVAILIIPIFDTLRVFFIRTTNGISPFVADRNHIHHRMLRLGLNHLQTTLILAGLNIFFISIVLLFNNYGNYILVILLFLFCLMFNWVITFLIRSKEREGLALRNWFL